MLTTLIVPGLHGSGPAHWQSWMERLIDGARRVEQPDWSRPDLPRWSQRVREEIDAARGAIVLVAHSFGCLASVAAARRRRSRIAGALLVAPADPLRFGVARHLPSAPLGFPAAVVSSTDDPWVSAGTARLWAERWAARFVDVGAKGHINVDSGFGPWPEGWALYASLIASLQRPTAWHALQARPPGRREAPLRFGSPAAAQDFSE